MTTRQDLEREREALASVLDRNAYLTESERVALRASIERVGALLSMDDTQINGVADVLEVAAHGWIDQARDVSDDAERDCHESAARLRTVADLVRRTS